MTITKLPKKVHIGEVIGNAIAFDFKRLDNAGTLVMSLDSLLQSVDDLFALLEERQVDYVLVDGIAMLQYIQGRNTQNIDLIMALNQLKQVPEIDVEDQNEYFARCRFDALQIDLLLTQNSLFDFVRKNHVTDGEFSDRKIRCATVEGLILLKLYALPSLYRQGDFARVGIYENDVATLIQAYNPDISSVPGELAHHLNQSDLNEVLSILEDIQRRLERFNQRN